MRPEKKARFGAVRHMHSGYWPRRAQRCAGLLLLLLLVMTQEWLWPRVAGQGGPGLEQEPETRCSPSTASCPERPPWRSARGAQAHSVQMMLGHRQQVPAPGRSDAGVAQGGWRRIISWLHRCM